MGHLRELVGAIGAERQGLFPEHGGKGQVGIKVREEIAAARGLEDELFAERISIDGDEEKIVLAGEMAGGGLLRLRRGGEMDVAVGKIDGGALENPGVLRILPQTCRNDLVDCFGHLVRSSFGCRVQP